jgi:hypothetical protein
MENKLPPFKFIKSDAIVKLEIGTRMIENLMDVLQYFSKDLTEQQIEKYHSELAFYNDIIKKEKQFSENWMQPVTTISIFLQEVEKQADLQGHMIEGDIEEYIKNSVNDIIEEGNQSAPQSQSQPE